MNRRLKPHEAVNHPAHYGGEENVYEAIKVIEAWGLGFCLGNTVKYISRAGKKGDYLEDLEKAAWYLNREVAREKERRRLACLRKAQERVAKKLRAEKKALIRKLS